MRKLLLAACIALGGTALTAENLVILHTNDTHSAIDPSGNTGGILQRKALIDSVRNAEKNVLLIDAGDMVQGSLYFKLWGGDVEYPLFNMMDYDIRILGNHEFDNGMEALAKHYKDVEATPLSANYDFSNSLLKGVFQPYTIKTVGGKKIGFIGINLNPGTIISDDNIDMTYMDAIEQANKYARQLKKKDKVDLVVAVTHIGYDDQKEGPYDQQLAKASTDIDVIIGGHSHTVVTPGTEGANPSIFRNAHGKPVLITQTGKAGRNLGYINIDLDKLNKKGYEADDYVYELIPVTNRFPEESLDKEMAAFLAPYAEKVKAINSQPAAYVAYDLSNSSPAMANMTADFAKWYGDLVADSIGGINGKRAIDVGFMNVGGIRKDWPKGTVSVGNVLDTYPFSNHFVIVDIAGADLLEALKIAAMKKNKEAVSDNVRVVMSNDSTVKQVYIGGKPLDLAGRYLVGTIDYVANGKDLLTPMAQGTVVWREPEEVVAPIMRYVTDFGKKGLPISPDPAPRFVQEVILTQPAE